MLTVTDLPGAHLQGPCCATRWRTRSATCRPEGGGQLGSSTGKFLAADAGHQVHRPHAVLSAPGHRADHLVAGGMAVGVVDALEVVDVDQQQQGRLTRCGPPGPPRGQRQLELRRLASPVSASRLDRSTSRRSGPASRRAEPLGSA
jgi:hypothetical protein